jgi:hypothetical protein
VELKDVNVWHSSKPEYFGMRKSNKIASGLCSSTKASASSGCPVSTIS